MNCPHCGTAGQTAGTNCANPTCGQPIPAGLQNPPNNNANQPGPGQAVMTFGPQSIAMPAFALGIAGQNSNGGSTQQLPPQPRSGALLVVLTLVAILVVVAGGFGLWGIFRDVPDPSKPALDQIQTDMNGLATTLSRVDNNTQVGAHAAQKAASLAQTNSDKLDLIDGGVLRVEETTRLTGHAVDYMGDIGYNRDGTVKDGAKIRGAIEAAQLAAKRAGRRIVVQTSNVDLSGVESHMGRIQGDVDSIKSMLNAPPVLERVQTE